VAAGAQGQRAEAVHQLLLYSLVGLGIMGALSGAVGWLVAGRALRPVHAITGAARRASEENLGECLALAGPPDELKELADTYDAMLARLDAAFASQRRFVANASHELRTPLTVMRTAIDVTLAKPGRTPAQLEDMAAEVRGAVDRAEALIEALLTLARSDRGTTAVEPADLAVLAEDALDAAAPAIRAGSLGLETALQPAPACVISSCSTGWWSTWWTTRSGTTSRAAGYRWRPGHGTGRRISRSPTAARSSPRTWPRCCSSRSGGWTGRRAAGPGRGWACPSSGR
jgi:signal transduction histidine kinase